jgi:ankyrin repeat protein
MFGQKGMALWLLEHGAQVNLTDSEGKTPLMLAIERQQEDIAALLRQRGGIESKR